MSQTETYETNNQNSIIKRVGIDAPIELINRIRIAAASDAKPDGARTTINEKYLECIELGLQVLEQRKSA